MTRVFDPYWTFHLNPSTTFSSYVISCTCTHWTRLVALPPRRRQFYALIVDGRSDGHIQVAVRFKLRISNNGFGLTAVEDWIWMHAIRSRFYLKSVRFDMRLWWIAYRNAGQDWIPKTVEPLLAYMYLIRIYGICYMMCYYYYYAILHVVQTPKNTT